MIGTERMTFADWQFSKRIVPWTIVHDWSEFAYWWRLLVARFMRAAQCVLDAFVKIVDAVRPAIDSFARLAATLIEPTS